MIQVEKHGAVTAIRMARSFLGTPIYWTAAYWLDGLLIDTGPRCTAGQLARVLQSVHVNQIAITHRHEDHIGGLALLQKHFPNATIYAPRDALPFIEEPEKLDMQLYRRLLWGRPRATEGVRSLDELANVALSTPHYSLRIIETPGHTSDHVSFFEPGRRWLFCGDAFIGGRDTSWPADVDMFSVISSLHTLASLRPSRLFPGSGHVRRVARPELHAKVNYLTHLCRQVAELDAEGLKTTAIVERLFDAEPSLTRRTFRHFSAANLIQACRSYNELMQLEVPSSPHPAPPRPDRARRSPKDENPTRSSS